MNTLKFICLAIGNTAKQICLLPWTLADSLKQREQRLARNELEAERLDRIRNPDKYRGK